MREGLGSGSGEEQRDRDWKTDSPEWRVGAGFLKMNALHHGKHTAEATFTVTIMDATISESVIGTDTRLSPLVLLINDVDITT